MQAADSGSPSEAFSVTSRLVRIRPMEVWMRLKVFLLVTTVLLPWKWALSYPPASLGATCETLPVSATSKWMTAWVTGASLKALLFLLRWERLMEAPTIVRVPPEA